MSDKTVLISNDIDLSAFSLASYPEVQAVKKRLADLQAHQARLDHEVQSGSNEVAALLEQADSLDVESLVTDGGPSRDSQAVRKRAQERQQGLEQARRESGLLERAIEEARKKAADASITARGSMVEAARKLLDAERPGHAELLLRLHEAERRQLAIEAALAKGIRGPVPPKLKASLIPHMSFIGPSSTGARGYNLSHDEAAECIRRISSTGDT